MISIISDNSFFDIFPFIYCFDYLFVLISYMKLSEGTFYPFAQVFCHILKLIIVLFGFDDSLHDFLTFLPIFFSFISNVRIMKIHYLPLSNFFSILYNFILFGLCILNSLLNLIGIEVRLDLI